MSRGRFQRSVKAGQARVHVIPARVDGTGTAAILSGGQELTLVDNGVGDYTLTFAPGAFAAVPTILVTPVTDETICRIGTLSASSVQILCDDATDGTTAKDADFHVMIVGSDSADEV